MPRECQNTNFENPNLLIVSYEPKCPTGLHVVNANGYFDQGDSQQARHALKVQLNEQRNNDFASGEYRLGGGVVDPLPDDAPHKMIIP